MGHLTKTIIVATLTVVFIATWAAATVTVNTPIGPLFVGATYFITWTLSGSTSSSPGILNVHNTANNNVTIIDDSLNLSNLNESWVINVVPGTYYLGINDGSGEKQSGQFQIISRGGGSTTGSSPTASGDSNSTTPTTTGQTTAADTTTGGTTATGATTGGATTGTSGPTTTTPSTKSGASTLRSSLLGLFVGLSVVALVMIQLF